MAQKIAMGKGTLNLKRRIMISSDLMSLSDDDGEYCKGWEFD